MKKIIIIFSFFVFVQVYVNAQCGDNALDNAEAVECNTTANAIKSAVAEVHYGTFRGTGTVVNNTNNDGRFLFLTSSQGFNCAWNGSTPLVGAHISGITFFWQHELTSCQDATIPVSTSSLNTTGATLLAYDNEFAIFELDDKPPFTKVTALGWDLSGNNPSGSFSIMHVYGVDSPAVIKNIYKAVLFPNNGIDYGSAVPYCWSSNGASYGAGGNPDYVIDGFTNGGPAPVNQGNTYSIGGPLLGSNKRIYGTYQTGDASFCTWGDSYFEKLQFMSSSVKNVLTNGQNVTSHHGISFTPCEDIKNINTTVNSSKTEKASIRIIASSLIVNNITVRYQAGSEVILDNGFSSGTDFIAEILPCDFEYYAVLNKTDGKEEVYNENEISTYAKSLNKVYPTVNKANGIVNIDFYTIDVIGEIKLYNMQGQLILSNANIGTNKAELKLPDIIDKGIYILKVLGENNQIETFKIFVE